MNTIYLKVCLAGLLFGIYPLLLNRSGLSGKLSALLFSGLIFVFVIPFTVSDIGTVSSTKWKMLIAASGLAATGTLLYNGVLATAPPQSVSTIAVFMITMQVAMLALCHAYLHGGVSLTKGIGFAFAAVAVVLLNKG